MITNSDIQLIAWFIAVIALVMSIYITLLSIQQRTNRWLSLIFLFLAVDSYAIGSMAGSKTVEGVMPGLYLSAALTPAIIPGLLLAVLSLMKPAWLHGRWRIASLVLQALMIAPVLVVAIDVLFGTHLIHRAFSANGYAGGFVNITSILNGPAGNIFFILNIVFTLFITLAIWVSLAGFDRTLTTLSRWLAWMMAAVHLILTFSLVFLRDVIGNGLLPLAVWIVYLVLYTYAAFQQASSERVLRKGRLHTRLAALTIGISLPLTIAVATLSSYRISTYVQEDAVNRLQYVSKSLAENITGWLDVNANALTQMVILSDIKSMDPLKQKPILLSMVEAHPDFYLVSTTDLNGLNVARSDEATLLDYNDRYWFQEIKAGAPIAYQIVKGKTTGLPALVMSVPIHNNEGILVGVGMFATELTRFSELVKVTNLGKTGYAYVLDEQNRVAAHPNPDLSLRDFSQEHPVINLRQGKIDEITSYKDQSGKEWLANGIELNNGWAVIAQQQKNEVFSNINYVGRISVTVIALGSLVLLILIWLAIRRVLQPVNDLTKTASAIASGDFSRMASVDSEDEIGTLARAFNAMTAQLRNSLSGLEKQVAERTLDLEVRSSYLQASAEVGQIAALILDPVQLSQKVVDLIRERFNLYYVGLFQTDQNNEWAVLKAGTGKAGQNMLANGHRIRVGSGMIGWCIANNQARIALEAGGDPVRLATSDLPDTRSEVALPLRSRNQVIGALTLQSIVAGTIDKDNITVFQILADQVAIALDNARLFAESQDTLNTMQTIYGEMSQEAWKKLLHEQTAVAYRGDIQGISVLPVVGEVAGKSSPDQTQPNPLATNETLSGEGDRSSLEIPITVRGNVIGVLDTHKTAENPAWKPDEIVMVQTVAEQLGLALESAQLYRESQYRAERERLISQITAQMRESLDVDTVLQTAAREMLRALGLQDITIQIGDIPHQGTITS
jgi:GAF domain-containing protein/HAMP domain-containing protein